MAADQGIAMNATSYLDTVTRYLALLEAGDVNGMAALFSASGQVFSPFLGWMSPQPFFAEVVGGRTARHRLLHLPLAAEGRHLRRLPLRRRVRLRRAGSHRAHDHRLRHAPGARAGR
jgi:hypothetical protein